MSWYEARDYCKTLKYEHLNNAHLVEIYDLTKQTFLKEKILEINSKTISWWIGLTDNEIEGVWKWAASGNIAKYISWGPGEPNNGGNGGQQQNCAAIKSGIDYKWDDFWCDNTNSQYGHAMPICQFGF